MSINDKILSSIGTAGPDYWQEKYLRLLFKIQRRALPTVRLVENGFESRFICRTFLDAMRPMTLWIKEAGTMEWISGETKPGAIFYDIGANIGIYTIAAAHRVGTVGCVYAFEPHKANALTLMQNLALNKLQERVKVFTFPLGDREGYFDFNYKAFDSGTTGSQLNHAKVAGTDREFKPVCSERVFSANIDWLLERGAIQPANLIKIDVDGNEILILKGMTRLLSSAQKPRWVQVELNVGEQEAIENFMESCGYKLARRHFTLAGKKKLAENLTPRQIAHNALFEPK